MCGNPEEFTSLPDSHVSESFMKPFLDFGSVLYFGRVEASEG